MTAPEPTAILFVCLGNICRSPAAEGVFLHLIAREGLDQAFTVDSAGTGDWHVGRPPHKSTLAAARRRGYELEHLRARQVGVNDFDAFDYILAMDLSNLADLRRMRLLRASSRIGLFLDYHPDANLVEVPDPYGGGAADFDRVLDMIETTSDALLKAIRTRHGLLLPPDALASQPD